MTYTAEQAWDSLKLKFSSGNSIDIERSTITRNEYDALLRERESAKAAVMVGHQLERWGKASEGSKYLLQPMADGYWTPWHVAQAALEAVAPMLANARVPDSAFILDRGFEYRNGTHTPTVTIGFRDGKWIERDSFAEQFQAAPKPETEE